MTGTDLPGILIDRRKLTHLLKLHIHQRLLIEKYALQDITRMIEEYCETDNAIVGKVVVELFRTIPRLSLTAVQKQLIEPTVGDLRQLRGITHYTVQMAPDLPEAVRTTMQSYLRQVDGQSSLCTMTDELLVCTSGRNLVAMTRTYDPREPDGPVEYRVTTSQNDVVIDIAPFTTQGMAQMFLLAKVGQLANDSFEIRRGI